MQVFILLNKENRDQWLPLFKSQSHSHVPSTESANKEDGDYEQVGSALVLIIIWTGIPQADDVRE